MNTEFHYYITGIVARASGFDEKEAVAIATASEFVDENDAGFFIKDRSTGESYEVYLSQTMNILKPKHKLMRIYPIFHFMPGDPLCDSACRRDGKMHLLNTTPGNDSVNELLDRACKSTEDVRLHRIGVATHVYADSWAHQNFVGWYDHFNHIGVDLKPNIGHADAEHHPDWVSHRWEDIRCIDDDVDNSERFIEAARNLYGMYRSFLKARKIRASRSWRALEENLRKIFGRSRSGPYNLGGEERIEGYRKLAPWLGSFEKDRWFDEAVETKIYGLKDRGKGVAGNSCLFKDRYFWREDATKEETNWFRFQEAVKAHQRDAMILLKPRFDRMGEDLHRH